MASIARQPNGRRTIQFIGADGKRRSIRLGKVSQHMAEAVKVRVEHLAAAQITGHALDDETARWLTGLEEALSDKLARVGLVPKRERATLAAFLDAYIAGRTDVKPLTKLKYHTTRQSLIGYFGADKVLRQITPGDADDWRRAKSAKGLSENTVRKHTAVAKLFFGGAKRKHLIQENPFAGLKASTQANPSRYYFVTLEEARKVLEACPDAQWRLLFALSRFGGLRCPSEHLGLRWGDVDWEGNRITVHSPKTEHHSGGDSRVIPIFPELRPYLEEAFELAEPGTEFIITRYRDTNMNLRTQLGRIIDRAGLDQWPKLFQNLRSTRETELAERFPMHVVCAWIGNSETIAAKHYLQVTDEHYAQAVQNPVQQPSDNSGNPWKPTRDSRDFQGLQQCTTLHVAEAGLEPAL
jgi:integrase